MKEKNDTTIHSAVINRAISYIFDHVDEDISVDDVAEVCGFSKHFQKQNCLSEVPLPDI